MFDRNKIEKDILLILQKDFNKYVDENNWINEIVFGKEIGMLPRDYLNLIGVIEEKYSIKINGNDIENYELKTFDQLICLILDKVKEYTII